MLQDDKQRKAYLQLMTNFVMGPPENRISNYKPIKKDRKKKMSKEIVKYMISPAQEGEMAISSAAVQFYSSLKKGITEDTVLKLSNRLCCERGYVILNDLHKRLYMHIGHNVQLWIDLIYNENLEKFTLHEKSMFEPKAKWKVFPNNIIKIESN